MYYKDSVPQCNVPVLFIFFNRLDIAKQSFAKIAQVKPKKIYLASDGGRNNQEIEVVNNIRDVILSSINWECEIKTCFQQTNLGCKNGVYTAIDWMFSQEESGIILEDDCDANITFFSYAEELLQEYKHDQRIGMITGHLFPQKLNINSSYCFSKYPACWGWATWRRAWVNMDIDMNWRLTDNQNILLNFGIGQKEYCKQLYKLRCIDNNIVSAWDFQWGFSLSSQNQLCIFPHVNLITNIGNDANATHTSFRNISIKSYGIDFPLISPQYICPEAQLDKYFFIKGNNLRSKISMILPICIKKLLKRVLSIYSKLTSKKAE